MAIYIRNLPFNISSEEMYDIFGKYGAIRQIRIGTNKDTRATAFVVYEDIYDSKNAVAHLSGFNFSIATWLCCIIDMLRCRRSSISARRRRNSPSFKNSMEFQQRRSRNSICDSRTATATMERRWSFTTVLVLLGVVVAWISEKLFYNQETNGRVLSLRVLDSISSKVTEMPLLILLGMQGLYNFLRLLQVSLFLVQDCAFPLLLTGLKYKSGSLTSASTLLGLSLRRSVDEGRKQDISTDRCSTRPVMKHWLCLPSSCEVLFNSVTRASLVIADIQVIQILF